MITVKYTKLDRAVYLGHLDVLKIFGMAIRRKAIPVEYSQGYNKHILLYMSQPLSLGLASECEYFCIASPCEPNEFAEKLNSSLPEGIRLLSAVHCDENPNISALMRAADYEVKIERDKSAVERISQVLNLPEIKTEYISKGKKIIKDIKPLIYSFNTDIGSDSESVFKFRLACGNLNLKADRFIDYLEKETGIKTKGFITKKHLYTVQNEKHVDMDEFLKMKKT